MPTAEEGTFCRFLANWIINDMTGLCRKYGTEVHTCGIKPETTLFIAVLMYEKHLTRKAARGLVIKFLEQL